MNDLPLLRPVCLCGAFNSPFRPFLRRDDQDEILIAFDFLGRLYPLSPKNAFYDWLYIRSLEQHADWIRQNVMYGAFTDIEFNPRKQVNCQARAFAEEPLAKQLRRAAFLPE